MVARVAQPADAAAGVLVTCYNDRVGSAFVGHRTVPTFEVMPSSMTGGTVWGLSTNFMCVFDATFTPPADNVDYDFRLQLDDRGSAVITDTSTGTSTTLTQNNCCGPRDGTISNMRSSRRYTIRVTWIQDGGDWGMQFLYRQRGSGTWLNIDASLLDLPDDAYAAHNPPPAVVDALSTLYNATRPWSSASSPVTRGWEEYRSTAGRSGYSHVCWWLGVEVRAHECVWLCQWVGRAAAHTPAAPGSGAAQ